MALVKEKNLKADGVTYEVDAEFGNLVPGQCYAEFAVTGVEDKGSRYKTCKFGRKFLCSVLA